MQKELRKQLYVWFTFFAFYKLAPRTQNILYRNDILILMTNEASHRVFKSDPPRNSTAIVEKTKSLYGAWLPIRRNMSRDERFGIGARIDNLLLDLLESLRRAGFAGTEKKLRLLDEAINSADSLRFFLQIAWETKLIPNKQYEELATHVEEIGRMSGGWRKGIANKTPLRVWSGERKE